MTISFSEANLSTNNMLYGSKLSVVLVCLLQIIVLVIKYEFSKQEIIGKVKQTCKSFCIESN